MEQILPYLVAAIPALTSIIGIVAAVVKMINSFKATAQIIKESTDTSATQAKLLEIVETNQAQMSVLLKENYELKKNIAVYTTKLTGVRADEKKSNN